LRRQQRAASVVHELIASGEAIATTRFNVAELLVGVNRSDHPMRASALLDDLLVGMLVLDFDQHAAALFGRAAANPDIA